MAPTTYKLYYFDTNGRGQIIRYLLAYGNQDFEDIRIPKEKWPEFKKKTPYGQVPILEIDGKPIAQSFAIARYLGKKFNLVGKNDLEDLECDSLVDTLEDLVKRGTNYFEEENPEQKEIYRKKYYEEDVPFYLEKFDAMVSKNGGYSIGSQLTWADFPFVGTLEELENRGPGLLKSYPALSSLVDKVNNLQRVKSWKEKSVQQKKYI
ncbi:glutathione S-transferase-like [Sitophilus oryzae]|uniref:glutathione transferase n=1 Tax=Sitophilus oryzae TaxID=7048 RepID=A0A6J2YJE5_SITOR|nr:glutathione S-transferase-like [Sitophilus oryzae]